MAPAGTSTRLGTQLQRPIPACAIIDPMVSLGGFTLAMNDNDANWMQFVANLAIHEAGIVQHGEIMPKTETLSRPGATDLLAEAL